MSENASESTAPAAVGVEPGSPGAWWLAIRPKTLSAAAAPVVVGSALAAHDGHFRFPVALAAFLAAILIQIGTNLANDVADYGRGADTADRLGPTRVVQAGLLSPRAVGIGAAVSYGSAALLGLYLVSEAGAPILVLGIVAILSGIAYTAGPFPLAYTGLADVFVLAFFGLAAVAGTYYAQALSVGAVPLAMGVATGALAVAILTVNNLRDIDSDRAAGKQTLVARIGAEFGRRYYALCVYVAFGIPVFLAIQPVGGERLAPGALLACLAIPLAADPVAKVLGGLEGRGLNGILGQTARLQIVHALLFSVGILLWPL